MQLNESHNHDGYILWKTLKKSSGLRLDRAAAGYGRSLAEKQRPVRGDNRTGQAIWALGVDGRSRQIQLLGRDDRSHVSWSPWVSRTFKAR